MNPIGHPFVFTVMLCCLAGLSGCIELGETDCTSDDDCRMGRVCATSGTCVYSDRADLDPDAGADAEPDSGAVDPYHMSTMRVFDKCEGDLHAARLVLVPPTREDWCEAEAPIRLVVDIEGALDLNRQIPGHTSLFADGISVTACEQNECLGTEDGELTLNFYQPGELVSGRLVANFPDNDRVSERISGQTYDLDIVDLQLDWCDFADDSCRR